MLNTSLIALAWELYTHGVPHPESPREADILLAPQLTSRYGYKFLRQSMASKPNQLADATEMVESFLQRYHYHRPHMGLGMKPPLTRIIQLPDI